MYHWFVRRQVRHAFALLSEGDAPGLVDRMAPDVHHRFPGHHALGGSRTGTEDVGAWFDRLFRLLPGLRFDVHAVAVSGSPLQTQVGVEWTNSGRLADGSDYFNRGAHMLHLSRGRITAFHAYLDDATELDDALRRLAAAGVHEAAAPPLTSAHPD